MPVRPGGGWHEERGGHHSRIDRGEGSAARDAEIIDAIEAASTAVVDAFRSDRKVLFCGNGGSAADAQHMAAELSARFYFDRPPLYAEALHVNTSYLTAVANDYSYADVFARMVRACGRQGDVLFGLTTSGTSPNVVKAVETARAIGMITVGMTGETGGLLKGACTYLIRVPSRDTARIQEAHITIGHGICEIVEARLFAPPVSWNVDGAAAASGRL